MDFKQIVVTDFEYGAPDGHHPEVRCAVFHELRSGRTLRLWRDELGHVPPFSTDRDAAWVAYYAPAELSCFHALQWPVPINWIDLYAEYRSLTNGSPHWGRNRKLVDALAWAGLDPIDAAYKSDMRDLALRGGAYTAEERRSLIAYCEGDVLSTAGLFRKLEARLNVPQALLRGRFLRATGAIEARGIPLDVDTHQLLLREWAHIKAAIIAEVDKDYGVFEGTTFKSDRWVAWTECNGVDWPFLPSGRPDLKETTFSDMAKAHPKVAPIHELRTLLAKLRLNQLSIGPDGRNRYMTSPFGAKSGRNAPSTTKAVFGPSKWLRSLIKPDPGRAVAYVDWSSQEIGIAAALSGDKAMQEAYHSADFYLAIAKRARGVPAWATKASHPVERNQFKTVALGTQYGMGANTLAGRLGISVQGARELLGFHQAVFPRFWEWSQNTVDRALDYGEISTVYGWKMYTGPGGECSELTLKNWPMQAHGAEMMRLGATYAHEAGLGLVATVHDALMLEGDAVDIDRDVARLQECMLEASCDVLDGFQLRSGAEIVRYPDRYVDERGAAFWSKVMALAGNA